MGKALENINLEKEEGYRIVVGTAHRYCRGARPVLTSIMNEINKLGKKCYSYKLAVLLCKLTYDKVYSWMEKSYLYKKILKKLRLW